MSKGINGFVPHMIIDTGRNGVAGMRTAFLLVYVL